MSAGNQSGGHIIKSLWAIKRLQFQAEWEPLRAAVLGTKRRGVRGEARPVGRPGNGSGKRCYWDHSDSSGGAEKWSTSGNTRTHFYGNFLRKAE